MNYSITLRGKRKFGASWKALEKAEVIFPSSSDVAFSKGSLLIDENKLDREKSALQKAIRLRPGHLTAIDVLARLNIREKRFNDA